MGTLTKEIRYSKKLRILSYIRQQIKELTANNRVADTDVFPPAESKITITITD